MTRPVWIVPVALVGLLSPASYAGVEWTPNGIQLSEPTTGGGLPQVLRDDAGGSYVVWRDASGCCGTTIVQRLDSRSAVVPGWPPHGERLTSPSAHQDLVSVLPDGSGGIVIVCLEYSVVCYDVCEEYAFGVRALRVLSNGAIAPGWSAAGTLVGGLGNYRQPVAAAPDLAGGVFIAWLYPYPPDLYMTHVDGAGTVSWTVPVCTAPGEQKYPVVVADGTGGAILAWQDQRIGCCNLANTYAQRLTATGGVAAGWPQNGLAIAPRQSPQQILPAAASDGSGGAIVAWGDFRNGQPWSDLYAQRVTAGGQIAPGWPAEGTGICLGPQFKRLIGLVPDDKGGAIAGWLDGRYAAISGGDIFAQSVSSVGSTSWAANGARMSPSGGANKDNGAAFSSDGAGGAYAVWAVDNPSTYSDILAGHVLAGGILDSSWPGAGLPISVAASDQLWPFIGWDGLTGAVIAWQDRRDGTDQVFAQRVTSDAVVSAEVALVSASATPTSVRLTWFNPHGAMARATVLRNSGVGYSAISEVAADGTGRIVYEDRDVIAGARYGYRLEMNEAGIERLTAETWLQVPAAPAFLLDRVWPSPSGGELNVSFGLAGQAPAALEILDLAGRRIVRREVGSLGAGSHVVALSEAQRLPEGVYVLRLIQERRSIAKRVVIAR